MNKLAFISMLSSINEDGYANELAEALADNFNIEKILELVPELSATMGCAQNHPAHCMDVFTHIIAVVKGLPNNKIFRLTALMHDLGKVSTKVIGDDGFDHFWGHETVSADLADQFMKRLGFSNMRTEFVKLLVKYHDYKVDIAELQNAISFFGMQFIDNIWDLNEVSAFCESITEKDAGILVLNYLFMHQISDLDTHSFEYAKRKCPLLDDLFNGLENEKRSLNS